MTSTPARPGRATSAFWSVIVGAVLLMAGGLLAATVSFDAVRQSAPPSVPDAAVRDYLRLYRGAGILFALAAALLAGFAVRARDGDPRFRRATVGLSMAVVVVVAVASVSAGTHILALLSMLPLVAGALLFGRARDAGAPAGGDDA